MKTLTILADNESTFDSATMGQMWKPNDKRFYMEFEGEDIEVRDEYHSMHELYQHRIALNIALCHSIYAVIGAIPHIIDEVQTFKSKKHSDGTMFDGYFVVIIIHKGEQISYHYKLEHWDKFRIPIAEIAPPYDGHTPKDVMNRLMRM